MSKHKRLKVGITCGDINGIGLEVILKSLMDSRVHEHCTPIIYASTSTIKSYMRQVNLEGFHFQSITQAEKADPTKVNVLNVWNDDPELRLGQSTADGGKYAFLSLQAAVEDLASTKVDVLVTAPINKNNIQSKEFDFPGHTEYLAAYANEDHPLMILVQDKFRVALVTGHLPLEEVASAISSTLIVEKLMVFSKSLTQDFGIHRPKIAVLGLNPHNGDGGLLGNEEQTVISPAIGQAREQDILAFGPFAADGFFGSTKRNQFDGVLAMYHDQGLAPFKALAFDEGVNFTAGLPIVRTSPDHGVAYDIAGQNKASESSFRQAILLACDIATERKHHRDISANPLELSDTKAK